MPSCTSSHSDASTHSLHSCGAVNPIELPKKKKQKPTAIWTSDEEAVFVDFLLSEFSASGDGNPKESTLNAAVSQLKERFLNASEAEKTADACKNKWQSVCYWIIILFIYFLLTLCSLNQLQCCCRHQEYIRVYTE
jgi:hypothetical protein